MPPLLRPTNPETITLAPRRALMAADTQVLVVGAGPAGVGAALGAAAAGARVILAERYGFPGGNATVAMVAPFVSYYTHSPESEKGGAATFYPTDHGPGRPVIAGVLKDFVDRMIVAGGALPPTEETGYVVPFDHEICKMVMATMLDKGGVQTLYHSFASDMMYVRGNPAVVFETKSGPVVIRASLIVDCTGDGDIAAFSGAPYEIGRETDGLVQPMTVYFRLGDVKKSDFIEYAQNNPDQWRGVHGLEELIALARERGELTVPRESVLLFGTPHDTELSVNATRVLRVVGTDVFDLSYAEWEGRKQIWQLARFFGKYVPGFRGAYVVQSATQVGVRETRRIVGDYQLTAEDVFTAQRFDDVIARSTYPIDIHNPEGAGTVLYQVPEGEAYDIPLRCLLPKGQDRLIVAGRCISGTHEAHSSYRVMPVAMAVGQAGGTCAALAAMRGVTARDIPYADVQEELLRQGAILDLP